MTEPEFYGRVLREFAAVHQVLREIKVAVGIVSRDQKEHEEQDESRFKDVRSDIRELRHVDNRIRDASSSSEIKRAEIAEARLAALEGAQRDLEKESKKNRHEWIRSIAIAVLVSLLTIVGTWLTRT